MCGSYQKYIKTIVTELLQCPVWSHCFLCYAYYKRSSYLANQNKNLQVVLLQTQYGNKVSTHFLTCTALPVSYI